MNISNTYPYGINLIEKPLFWLGDKFYKVEEERQRCTGTDRIVFASKCPSCNGTRKITYKGYNGCDFECDCPVCKDSIIPFNVYYGYGDQIELINWAVHQYIVNEISAKGPKTVSAYRDGIGYVSSVCLTAFHKTGRGAGDFIKIKVPSVEDLVDPEIESMDMESYYFIPKNYVFRKETDAAKLLNALKEYDRKRLIKFNETYGTDHKYPF